MNQKSLFPQCTKSCCTDNKRQQPYKHWTFSGWATLEHRNMLMFFLDIRLNFTVAWFSLTQQMQRKVYMIIIWGCVPGPIFAEHSFSKLETDCIRAPQKIIDQRKKRSCASDDTCIHFIYCSPAIQVFFNADFFTSHSFLHLLFICPGSYEFEWKKQDCVL